MMMPRSVGGPSAVNADATCFTLSYMKDATKNFDESLKLGEGGFGTVYKGTVFDSDTDDSPRYVAVKRAKSYNDDSLKQFRAEVELLSRLSHHNVVSLIGYCLDKKDRELLLVYEYMYNGTLYDRLYKLRGRPPLTWVRRLKILLGVARGLSYLHSGTHFRNGVLHRDIKSANLLLDKFFEPKICDFGLAKTGPPGMTSNFPRGTPGYADPHYIMTNVPTLMSDVYAFGVMMFELVCGTKAQESDDLLARKATKFCREGNLLEIVDSNVKKTISSEGLKKFGELACECVDTDLNKRPTMAKVVARLENILALNKMSSTKSGFSSFISYRKKEKVNSLELYLKTVGGEFRTLHRFDFETIDVATENFAAANRILKSNLGTMYKGKLQNGEDIAIVARNFDSQTLDEVYENQLSILVKLEHENVFQLHGYCIQKTRVYLLFNCAPYASLESLIFDPNRPLDLEKKYKILLDVAHAVLYLHMHAPVQVVGVAVTPCKIVLDKNWNPKLSGYCFVASRVPDTSGHIEPSKDPWVSESLEQSYLSTDITCSTESDVFSYGVLILETITGRCRKDPSTELLEDYVRNSLLQGRVSDIIVTKSKGVFNIIERYLMVGVLCTQEDAAGRPTMETVVEMLLGNSAASDGLLPKIRESNVNKWNMKVRDKKKKVAQALNK